MAGTSKNSAAILLFFLFFLGCAVTLLAWIDLQWTHRVLVNDAPASKTSSSPRETAGRTRQ